MTISSSNFSLDLIPYQPGFQKFFGDYKGPETTYDKLFEVIKSNGQRYKRYVQTRGTGLASVKPEGQSIALDDVAQVWNKTIEQVVYGLGFNVTWEAMRDGNVVDVAQRGIKEVKNSMIETREIVTTNIFNRATNSSYTGGDGKTLLATDHPLYAGGTFSNKPSTDLDITELAIEQMIIDVKKFKNERGRKAPIRVEKLLVPVDTSFELERILTSPLQYNSADNNANILKARGSIKEVVESLYLTDTDSWFGITNAPDGFVYWEDYPMTMLDDAEVSTMNALYYCVMRYVADFFDPRAVYGSTGG